MSCFYRHLHIVKYLINLHKTNPIFAKINIHAYNEEGFRYACCFGYKHIIKYLLSCGSYYSNNYTQYIIVL